VEEAGSLRKPSEDHIGNREKKKLRKGRNSGNKFYTKKEKRARRK